MSKLFNVEADGSLKFSIESKLLENVRKAHSWYTSKEFSWIAFVILIAIDIAGFLQIAEKTMSDSLISRGIIVSAFAVAFEVAPLYIGYVLCLKSYGLWRPIGKFDLGKFILILSVSAFALGAIANCIYRFMTMDIAYKNTVDAGTDPISLPMTVLMVILPIITTFVNIVIGCLSFDPLLFDLLRLTKKLRVLKIRKRQLASSLEMLSNDDILREELFNTEEQDYLSAKRKIWATRLRLLNYIAINTDLLPKDIDN